MPNCPPTPKLPHGLCIWGLQGLLHRIALRVTKLLTQLTSGNAYVSNSQEMGWLLLASAWLLPPPPKTLYLAVLSSILCCTVASTWGWGAPPPNTFPWYLFPWSRGPLGVECVAHLCIVLLCASLFTDTRASSNLPVCQGQVLGLNRNVS